MDEKELRKMIWQKTMLLSIEMGHRKTQFLKGKYAAFKEIWEELGGDIIEPQSATLQELCESGL